MNEILNVWNTKNNALNEHKISNSELIFTLKNYEKFYFKILFPKNKNEFMILDSDHSFSWIDDFNIKIIERSYTLEKLLDQILSKLNSTKKERLDKITKKSDSDILIVKEKTLDDVNMNEIKFIKKKKEIELIMDSSKSTKEVTQQESSKKLFDEDIVLKIIKEEFLNLYEKSLNSTDFEINIINDNIYHWNIKERISNFILDYDVKLTELYPNYPPEIKINSPRFANNLANRIYNLKMIKLEYWSPTRDIKFVTNKLKSIIEKNGSVDCGNSKYTEIESLLYKFGNFIDADDDTLDSDKYSKFVPKSQPINDTSHAMYYGYNSNKTSLWNKGTGYGHSGLKEWDIKAYVKSQEEKDNQLKVLLSSIISELEKNHKDITSDIIKNSSIMNFITEKLRGMTYLEMIKHKTLYISIIKLVKSLYDHFPEIFIDDNSILIYLKELFESVKSIIKSVKDEDEIKEITNEDIYAKLKELYDGLHLEFLEKVVKESSSNSEDSSEQKYHLTMRKLCFDESPLIFEGGKYYYSSELEKDKNKKIKYTKRMITEHTALQQSCPTDFGASIFIRIDPNNISTFRVLITGPHDTPYESGCFIFDVYIPNNFPNTPPLVWLLNTGGKRFNPNLYDTGKVCLSILGTWSGDKSESWNQDTSTLLQVFLSIQSLILIDNPYFNEPGHEFDGKEGMTKSNQYNNPIRYYTMCSAIRDLLKSNEYPQFEEVIKNHFKLKQDRIKQTMQKWINEAPDVKGKGCAYNRDNYSKAEFQKVYDEIVELFNKLN